MKKTITSMAVLLAALLVLAACGGAPATQPQSTGGPAATREENTMESTIYRGEVTAVEEGSITVNQLPGHNYGQQSIVFHLPQGQGASSVAQEGIPLAEGAFVEVQYSGMLTRSMPPQGTANEVTVLAPYAQGIVVNGTVQSVQQSDDGYRLEVLPFEAQQAAESGGSAPGYESMVILNVPQSALEGIAATDLKEGLAVSAVTKGVAALSLPPQMPVHALLPYTE